MFFLGFVVMEDGKASVALQLWRMASIEVLSEIKCLSA
jgi:hypothetical protein